MTMRWWILAFGTMAAAAAGAAACGGGDGESGVEADKRLSELDDDEIGRVCDWGSDLFGGYGAEIECSGTVTLVADPSRAECIEVSRAQAMNCTATVGEYEACAKALVADACAISETLSSDVCRTFAPCLPGP